MDAAYSGGFSPFGEDVVKVGVDAEFDSSDSFVFDNYVKDADYD